MTTKRQTFSFVSSLIIEIHKTWANNNADTRERKRRRRKKHLRKRFGFGERTTQVVDCCLRTLTSSIRVTFRARENL